MIKLKKLGQNGDISVLFIILAVILLIAGSGYYIWQRNNNKSSYQQKTSTKATTNTVSTTACTSPTSSEISNIESAVSSGNTAALEGYMANPVKVILAATEGIGDQTPTQAVNDVTSFIGDTSATTWDFTLPAATITGYKSTPYVTYFPTGAVVGKDSTSKVISFSFDCNGKISTVFEVSKASILQ